MEYVTDCNKKPVFENQPILCPWTACQPYPSSPLLKNKLGGSTKNHGSCVNSSSPRTLAASDLTKKPSLEPPQQPSSTHFFYFLRLMQLFPDTHPATLHTVLTLSKNNFFFAIDKLLYAQKCKNDLGRRLSPCNGRGSSYVSSRGRPPYMRANQRYQSMPRSVHTGLAEVKRFISMDDVESGKGNQTVSGERQLLTNQVVEICVENPDELVQGSQRFVDADTHEVIEIVCFDNDQTMLKQSKDNDSMEMETYEENVGSLDASISDDLTNAKMEEDPEPSVIVVDSMADSVENDYRE